MIIPWKTIGTVLVTALLLFLQPVLLLAQGDLGSLDKVTDTIRQVLAADLTGIIGMIALVLIIQSIGVIYVYRTSGRTVSTLAGTLQIIASGNDQNVEVSKAIRSAIESQTAVIQLESKVSRDHQILVAESLAGMGGRVENASKHLETLTGKIDKLTVQIVELHTLVLARNNDRELSVKMVELLAGFQEIAKAIEALAPSPNDTEPDDAPPPASKTGAKVLQVDAAASQATVDLPVELMKTG